MTDRGRHSRPSGAGFYRDVLYLVAGILIVGAVVFGGLSLWAGRNNTTTTTTTADTVGFTTAPSSIIGETTTSPGGSVTTNSTPTTTIVPTTTVPPTTLRPERATSEVSVIVLNSIGVAGLAAELSDELEALGYQVLEADNYTPELSDTVIFHADGFSLEALTLNDAVPDGTVAPGQDLATEQGADIVVVIGQSYQG